MKHRYILIILTLLSLMGCAKHNFIPNRLPMPKGLIPQFSANTTVNIINESDSEMDDVNVMVWSVVRQKSIYYINYRTWTDEIIDILKAELALRGISVVDESEKILKIKLKNVYFSVPFMGFHCRTYMTLDVSVGGYFTKTFSKVLGKSGINSEKASANAMLHTVEAIINDAEIQRYLRGAPEYLSSGKNASGNRLNLQ